MKKIVLAGLMAAVVVIVMSGCAVKAKVVKTDIMSQPIRSTSVHIVSPEVFEDSRTMGFWLSMPVAFLTGPVGAVAVPAGMSADYKAAESKFFVKPTDDKKFRDEISSFYAKEFKAEMEKNGFMVVEKTNDDPLVIEAKIGIMVTAPIFKRVGGVVAMEVEIYQKDVLVSRLQTNSIEFNRGDPASRIKDLLKEVARELKKNFL